MREIPKAGEYYRHFKGKEYLVKGIAHHSETGEELVIYEAQYGEHAWYARPVSMFLEDVDREKYPDCPQKERFQKIEVFAAAGEDEARHWLLDFLDAESWKRKREILLAHQEEMTEELLEACAESMDLTLNLHTLPELRFYQLLSAVETREKYEKER